MSLLTTRAFAGIAFCAVALITPLATYADTIVQVAQGNSQFSSLVNAVVSQDLAATLSGAGPYTVFAPTNDAFANLPQYVRDALAQKPELLKEILLYHVVPGDFDASEVLAVSSLTTASGATVMPRLKDGQPYINKAKITATDIIASNGRVHVIDMVLIPDSVKSIAREMQNTHYSSHSMQRGEQNQYSSSSSDCRKNTDYSSRKNGSHNRTSWRHR